MGIFHYYNYVQRVLRSDIIANVFIGIEMSRKLNEREKNETKSQHRKRNRNR